MPQPDITDPTIAKAYAHPLRIEIMGLLDNRTASPREIASELDAPLSNTSYHVRQLASLGLVRLVERRQRRGAIEHFYTAIVRPRFYDEVWARLPTIVKRSIIGGRLAQIGREVTRSAEVGGFDAEDIHLTRTRATFTRKTWETISKELAAMLARLDELKAQDASCLQEDPHQERVDTTVVMMMFESPSRALYREAGEPFTEGDEALQETAPPR